MYLASAKDTGMRCFLWVCCTTRPPLYSLSRLIDHSNIKNQQLTPIIPVMAFGDYLGIMDAMSGCPYFNAIKIPPCAMYLAVASRTMSDFCHIHGTSLCQAFVGPEHEILSYHKHHCCIISCCIVESIVALWKTPAEHPESTVPRSKNFDAWLAYLRYPPWTQVVVQVGEWWSTSSTKEES